MNILLVGSGGREHALAWALTASDQCAELYCAPGNAGIESCAECVDIGVEDIDALVDFAKDKKIDLVVVGPEAPLVKGLADRLQEAGIDVFGPSADAAQLEGSKAFTKDLCAKYDIPTAKYGRFKDVQAAQDFIREMGAPLVVKADGLAAGKGVVICDTIEEALQSADSMLSAGTFGNAGEEIVVEEFLDGEEISYFALADGNTILPLTSAQDHKRAYDGNTGPNTGGMGAYSPAHSMDTALEEKVIHTIIQPTVEAMKAEGMPFTGVLYAGLMIVKGEPMLIEYNARFGDPECQALMMRLQGDLLAILQACAQGRLDDVKGQVTWKEQPTLCVVMAAKGYPGSYAKNTVISNLDDATCTDDVVIFHAGTKKDDQGQLVNVGGRVLGITAMGEDIEQARDRAYAAVDKISWPDGFCRRDIAWRALDKDNKNKMA